MALINNDMKRIGKCTPENATELVRLKLSNMYATQNQSLLLVNSKLLTILVMKLANESATRLYEALMRWIADGSEFEKLCELVNQS